MSTHLNTLLLHISLIKNVGPAVIESMVQAFSCEQLKSCYSYTVHDFMKCGLSEKKAQLLVNSLEDKDLLEQELALIQKEGIKWCTIFDDEYPSLLKEIHLPPPVVYYRGTLPGQKALAFVGSRATSMYGKQVITSFVPDLVQSGWTIVSGGAYGIDAAAHQEALNAGGTTVVVLGSGLLRPYPRDHERLFESIVQSGGCVMSTFSLTTGPAPYNFPVRNRVIAGLSKGCVVVRAAQKSGALITAQYALQEGRHVFSVPGSITDKLSKGCHELIGQGAVLTDCVEVILKDFGDQYIQSAEIAQSGPEDELITLCQEPQSIENLVEILRTDENKLKNRLFELQLEGVLEQNFAGLWQCV